MTVLYGIPNCDTIKKAKKWLESNDVEYQFHDFRKDGLEAKQLQAWSKQVGWEVLLNKRGTTWRQLPEETKNSMNEASALALMLDQPAMIKRPVLEIGNKIHVGFKADDYKNILL